MQTDNIDIIEFDESLSSHFKDLNIAWLQKYFYVEAVDKQMLSNPKRYIIDAGGHIFFSKLNNEIAGTFALMKVNDEEFELGKMAVDEKYQGQKIGNKLLQFAIRKAGNLGALKIILYSNTTLGTAIHLYKKYGFAEVPMRTLEYKRSNIKMEKLIS